jgi:hypothetical protein
LDEQWRINSTKQAIWSRDQLVAYLNSRKVGSKELAKVEAIRLTSKLPQQVLSDAQSQGCEYLVIIYGSTYPTAEGSQALRPENLAQQLAPGDRILLGATGVQRASIGWLWLAIWGLCSSDH